jgi:hypothetical protein
VVLAGVTVLIAAGLAWTARLVPIGNLDAHDLADKLSAPAPVSAPDWPGLHLNAVVAQPGEQPAVLLHADRPAHPQRAATSLLALDRDDRHSLPLLSQWRADQASSASRPIRNREAGPTSLIGPRRVIANRGES